MNNVTLLRPSRRSRAPFLFAAILHLTLAASAAAQPTLGFREEFVGGIGGWSGGTAGTIVATGGRLGTGDPYLQLDSAFPGNYGTRCRLCTEYTGDWSFAGITQVRVWLNELTPDDGISVHLCLGNDTNFWQYDVSLDPPSGEWAEYVVDLTDTGNWTQIIDVVGGSFQDALSDVSIVLIRHDESPYMQQPDPIAGNLGIDGILLTNGVVSVGPSPVDGGLQMGAPYPNPSRGPVTFALQSIDASPIDIRILDVSGRVVRSVELAGATGPRTWMWDGRDDGGRLAAPGAYRARVSSASGAVSRPFTRIR